MWIKLGLRGVSNGGRKKKKKKSSSVRSDPVVKDGVSQDTPPTGATVIRDHVQGALETYQPELGGVANPVGVLLADPCTESEDGGGSAREVSQPGCNRISVAVCQRLAS